MQFRLFNNPDLHMHSVFSDGTDTLEELISNVKAANVDIFSLTDHDNYAGCEKIKDMLKPTDPFFISGIEVSCEDDLGKYHILGYCYDTSKPSIVNAVNYTRQVRFTKAANRLKYLESIGYEFSDEEKDNFLSLKSPGKPHLAKMMLDKGYIQDKKEGFDILRGYKGEEKILSPIEAIEAILEADGIPVLAHGIKGDGSKNFTEEQITIRVERLKKEGLMGVECFYSTFTDEQVKIMLELSKKYNLMVTAGSDYHGSNKVIKIGETNNPIPKEMERFYKAVSLEL